jgi:hypothetical protein
VQQCRFGRRGGELQNRVGTPAREVLVYLVVHLVADAKNVELEVGRASGRHR